MSISPEFKENVQSCNVIRVRSALLDDLIIDRTFKCFDEALEYALQTLPVIQEHDNKFLEENSLKWDKKYLNRQKANLMVNFSQKRIEHLKEVITAVLPAPGQTVVKPAQILHTEKLTQENATTKELRTGRVTSEKRIKSEEPQILKPNIDSRRNKNQSYSSEKQNKSTSKKSNINQKSPEENTGRRVISEERVPPKDSDEKRTSQFDPSMALMVGGVAVATAGVIIAKPIIIGAGVVMIGVGGAIKVSGNKNK